jgi:hypothetical protein
MKRGVVAAHRQLTPVAAHADKDLSTEGEPALTALAGIGIQSGLHHVQRTQAAAQILGPRTPQREPARTPLSARRVRPAPVDTDSAAMSTTPYSVTWDVAGAAV